MTDLKRCTGCHNDFPATLEYFHAARDGIRARCKACIKQDYPPVKARGRHSIPQKMIPAAMALHCRGFTYDQIAEDLGVTRDAVVSLFAERMRAA